QHSVAIHQPSAVIGEDRAIAVAIKGDSHLRARRADELGEPLGMCRAAIQVDVAAIWFVRDDDRFQPETPEQLRRDSAGRPVRTIDRYRRAAQRRCTWPDRREVTEIRLDQI